MSESIYPFPNFNDCTGEIWEWITNFITWACAWWDKSESLLVKVVPAVYVVFICDDSLKAEQTRHVALIFQRGVD